MEKKEYQKPTVYTLGKVEDLTQIPGFNKCAGSADSELPNLTPFTMAACPPTD